MAKSKATDQTDPLQQEADEAGAAVAQAKTALDEAATAHEAAKSRLATAQAAMEPVPEKGKHILVDFSGGGSYTLMAAPDGWDHDRRLLLNGVNVEHVSDHESGVWHYRAM